MTRTDPLLTIRYNKQTESFFGSHWQRDVQVSDPESLVCLPTSSLKSERRSSKKGWGIGASDVKGRQGSKGVGECEIGAWKFLVGLVGDRAVGPVFENQIPRSKTHVKYQNWFFIANNPDFIRKLV